MFECKGTLLISVALNASCVSANGQSGLFQLKTTMRIVAIAASQSAFKDLVMRRHGELMFNFTMAAKAKLWLTDL
jgi:hypothetical protein